MSLSNYSAEDVLDFWFAPAHQTHWFSRSTAFDDRIRQQFAALHHQAAQGELWSWRTNAEGRLAEIIILDQFSRQIYRDQAQAFAQDAMALALAQEAISQRLDQQLDPVQRRFIYMPLMHSESLIIHQRAYVLFQRLGDDTTFEFEKQHQAIIQRFGRYPHRNAILNRQSTEEEQQFLTQAGSHF